MRENRYIHENLLWTTFFEGLFGGIGAGLNRSALARERRAICEDGQSSIEVHKVEQSQLMVAGEGYRSGR